MPHLKGEQTDSPHEYLFWLNNQPDDAVRRHLIAVRWRDWRLYKKYAADPWQLFDLKADPKEEKDVAQDHAGIVRRMAEQHAAWEKTLAPLKEVPDVRSKGPIIPSGHGWAFAQ